MIAVLSACGPRPETARTPSVEAPRDAARLAAVSPVALATDAGTIYYADLEGVWALSVMGGDAKLVTAPPKLVERIVPHGAQLVLGTAEGVLAVPVDGGPVQTLLEGPAPPFAVDDDGVWFVDGASLRMVPLTGGDARTIADGVGETFALPITDGDAVYVAANIPDPDELAMTVGAPPMAITRYAKRDGARTTIARRQFGVAGMLRRDDRLYWTSVGAGLRSAPSTGGDIRTELGGGGVALAADEDGIVVQTDHGLLVEVRREGARVATSTTRGVPEISPGLVLSGGAVVSLVTDPSASASELWRLPRPWRSTVTVAGWVTERISALAADGDALYILDAPVFVPDLGGIRDYELVPGRVLRIDARGQRRVLASDVEIDQLAVENGTVVYRTIDAIWRIDPDKAPVRAVSVPKDAWVLGLVLSGGALYWTDSDVVRTASARGGAATTLFTPEGGIGGTGLPFAQMVVDRSTVYISSLGWGSMGVRRVASADRSDLLFDSPDESAYLGQMLVRAGDALYTTLSSGEIWRVPLSGAGARAVVRGLDGPPVDLVGVGDRVVVLDSTDGVPVLSLLEPLRGKMAPLATFSGESSILLAGAPKGDAVYAGLVDNDLVVRIPIPPAR